MDSLSFDRLTRLFVAAGSRRAFGSTLLGALAALVGLAEAAAAPCPKGKKRCGKRCIPRRQCCTHANCRPGATGRVCRQGRCQCPPSKRPCAGRCIAKAACCRHAECGALRVCAAGACRCADGLKLCAGGCIPQSVCCACADDQVCIGGDCATTCGNEGVCRVFATSTIYNGNLGGVSGADAKCRDRAVAAGLTGTYKAWLSGSAVASSPSVRFTNTANTGPYVLLDPDATEIATSWADLIDGELLDPINKTEFGLDVPQPPGQEAVCWTSTEINGTPAVDLGAHCDEWSHGGESFAGLNGSTMRDDDRWTRFGGGSCDIPQRLYCFEQG